jgi:hypothetical protein
VRSGRLSTTAAHTKHVPDEIQKKLASVGSSMEKVLKDCIASL